jgi:hypothetical protein
MPPSTIGGINRLPEEEKRKIYSRVIPTQLLDRFNLPAPNSIRLQSLLKFDFEPGSTTWKCRCSTNRASRTRFYTGT